MTMIKDKHQYHVCGWMINQLHLDGKELQCYAIIYSLSQLGEGRYIAGLSFLAEFMQCSQPTASAAVKALFNKGLILKDEIVTEYGRRVFYYCTDEGDEKENTEEDCEKENTDDGVHKNFMDGVHKNFMSKYNNKEIKEKRLSNDNQKIPDELFISFWEKYGYKRGKKDAEAAWKKLSKKDKENAINAIPVYKEDCRRCERQMRQPSVYLNKRTWEDDFTNNGMLSEEEPTEESTQPDLWQRQQEWFKRNVPNIAHLITKEMYGKMRIICIVQMDFQQALLNMNEGFEGDFLEAFREEVKRCAGG